MSIVTREGFFYFIFSSSGNPDLPEVQRVYSNITKDGTLEILLSD